MSPVSTLLATIVLMCAVLPAHASGTPASKCATAKQKAAVKKLAAKLKCYQKASAKGVPVDGTCLTAAETKFAGAIVKADAKGGCLGGTASLIESDVDKCLSDIRADTPDAPVTCGQTPFPECGGACPGNMICQATVTVDDPCGSSQPSCGTGCQCVDPATACDAGPCGQMCSITHAGNQEITSEQCCSGLGGPCDLQSGTPRCCCGTCVQQPGSIGTCQNGYGCDAQHIITACQ